MYDQLIQKIRSIYKDMDVIPLHAPVFRGKEKSYVVDCIDTTFVSTVGRYSNSVEEKLKEITGSAHAVAVVNGTSAVHAALLLNDVSSEDEVLCQSLTFVATANAIAYCKADLILVDADPTNLSMCPQKLEEWLKNNTAQKDGITINKKTLKKIRTCLTMHTLGHPGHVDAIQAICAKYNITLIEDAAESLGSFYKGKHTGTLAPIGTLSFNGNKIVTAGGGGALLIQDEALAKKARHLTTTAKVPHKWEYEHDVVGYNYRMPNINAALLLAQLEELDGFLERKRAITKEYEIFFKELGIKFISQPNECVSNYWLNAIQLKSKVEKENFLEELNKNNIQARGLWKPMHTLKMYKNCQRTDMSVTDHLYDTILCLPSGVN